MKEDPLRAYAASRQALLARIAAALSADERVVAAWLEGGLGRDEADAVSDLDLAVVLEDIPSRILCARPWMTGAGTTPERAALVGRFGDPVIVYENHYNVPDGSTLTSVLYRESALMVDWVLIPRSLAVRPPRSALLFDRVGLPVESPAAESLDERIAAASARVAFFWMMAAITAKYVVRRDAVKVQGLLDMLQENLEEVERLAAGRDRHYRRGSHIALAATAEEQIGAIRYLGARMLALMPRVAALGGQVPASPMEVIERLLALVPGRGAAG